MSNTIVITGNIAEPSKGQGSDGTPVLNLRIADTPRKKNDQGEWEDAGETLWVGAAVWGDDALELANHVTKGTKVTATGRLTTRAYEKDGQQREAFEIKGATVAVVHSAPRQQDDAWGGGQQAAQPPAPQQSAPAAQQQPAQQGWGGSAKGGGFDEPPF